MKKLTLALMAVCVLGALAPTTTHARTTTEPTTLPANTPAPTATSTALTDRLDEINALDKSNLSRTERKQLRKEVRSIKSELAINSGGIYLSVGAVILIVVLLVLLL